MIPSVRTVPSTSVDSKAVNAFLTLRKARDLLLMSSAMLFLGALWVLHPVRLSLFVRREAWLHAIIHQRHAGTMSGYALSLLVASQCRWTSRSLRCQAILRTSMGFGRCTPMTTAYRRPMQPQSLPPDFLFASVAPTAMLCDNQAA